MSGWSGLLGTLAALGLALPTPADAQGIDLDSIVTLSGTRLSPTSPTPRSLGIHVNEIVSIEFDEIALLREVGLALDAIALGEPLETRIGVLRELVSSFQAAQAALLDMKRVGAELEAQRLAGIDTASARAAFRLANEALGRAALPAVKLLLDSERLVSAMGDQVRAEQLVRKANEQILGGYEGVSAEIGMLLEGELRLLDSEIHRRLEDGSSVRVRVEAFLNTAGERRALALGFPVGPRVPYERFQFAASERTRRELEATRELGRLVENPEALREQIEAAVAALREVALDLRLAVQADLLRRSLGELVSGLRDQPDATLVSLRQQAEAVLGLLAAIETGLGLRTGDDVATLLVISGRVDGAIQGLIGSMEALRLSLPNLVSDLEAAQSRLPQGLREQAESILGQLASSAAVLSNSDNITTLRETLLGISRSLGITRRVVDAGSGLNRFEATLAVNETLDTRLFLDAAGERHPGDLVDISMTVVVTDPAGREGEQVLARAHQTLRLELLGLYLEPRGALLFADPRTSGFAGQTYEPTASLSWVAHVGFEDAAIWNDFLNPGLSVTMALLDFADEDDLEVGISGSVTLMRDFFFVGYGRNLQAGADFFYIGVNPLAFGDLLRLRGGPGVGGS